MEREYDQREELIDLGAASVETQGNVGEPIEGTGLFPRTGLAED